MNLMTGDCVTHTWTSRVTRIQWVMSLIWISHITHMNESSHAYEWVLEEQQLAPGGGIWRRLELNVILGCNESRDLWMSHDWVAWYFAKSLSSRHVTTGHCVTCISDVTHMKWVMSHIWLNRVTYLIELRKGRRRISTTWMNPTTGDCVCEQIGLLGGYGQ